MGMEQVVGVAYGVSFAGDEIKDFMGKFGAYLNFHRPGSIDNLEAFAEYPQEGLEEIVGLNDIFSNTDFNFWYDENNGEENLLVSVRGSHKRVVENYASVSPTKLGSNWNAHELDGILGGTGYGHLSAEWIFYAYVI